jgi:hypothetical protein
MNISEYINQKIEEQGRQKNWIAEQLGTNYKTFCYRLKNNSLTAEELIKLSDILGFDMNELKKYLREEFIMKQLSKVSILEYKYESEEERENHVNYMKSQGWECSGQVRKSDDSLMDKERVYYWYGRFLKSL